MPEFQPFLADVVVPKSPPNSPEPSSAGEAPEPATPVEIASPTDEPVPIPDAPSPLLPVVVATFILVAVVAVVLISLKARRGRSS